jgi:hypothetical protein
MKIVPIKFYEVDAKIVHCGPPDGPDFTLCGFTLDGDQGEIIEWEGSRIDCPRCLSIIKFCQSITARSLSLPSPVQDYE